MIEISNKILFNIFLRIKVTILIFDIEFDEYFSFLIDDRNIE